MKGMVDQAIAVLQSNDAPIEDFGKLAARELDVQATLSDKVTTAEIDELYEEARAQARSAARLLGAGGGGFLLLFVPPEHQTAGPRKALPPGSCPVPFENTGSRVVLYQPSGL